MAETKQNSGEIKDNVVRLQGLPFSATKKDIENFFGDDFNIVDDGILLQRNANGRASGQAYVQFGNADDANKALGKNKQNMGHRYIEVYPSSMEEAYRNTQQCKEQQVGSYSTPTRNRPGSYGNATASPHWMGKHPYGRGYGLNGPPWSPNTQSVNGYNQFNNGLNSIAFGTSSNGNQLLRGMPGPFLYGNVGNSSGLSGFERYKVQMRGLPFQVTEEDILRWFSPVANAINVKLIYNNDGRASGNAEVLFASEMEAMRAMTKNKENLQHRYIELYYAGPVMSTVNRNSTPSTGTFQMRNSENAVVGPNGWEAALLSGSRTAHGFDANSVNVANTGIDGFGLQTSNMGGTGSSYAYPYNWDLPY